MISTITFELNRRRVQFTGDPDRPLLWVLRTDFGLTGTKYGCGAGICGACTVLVDDGAVRSCQVSTGTVEGRRVVTIEGLARDGTLHPLQAAFVEEGALQCGYCTPGMILTAYDLLRRNPSPTVGEIVGGMDGNFCRCGAHTRIVRAIQRAGREMEGRK